MDSSSSRSRERAPAKRSRRREETTSSSSSSRSRERGSKKRRPRNRSRPRQSSDQSPMDTAEASPPSLLTRLGQEQEPEDGEVEEPTVSLLGRVGLNLQSRLGDSLAVPAARPRRRQRKRPRKAVRDNTLGHGGAL
jgi:hypothetical protein